MPIKKNMPGSNAARLNNPGFFGGCCCDPGCLLAQDVFTRSNNTDINVGAPFVWTGDVASFEIAGNRLKSVAAGTIWCPIEHPYQLPNIRATVDCYVASAGQVFGVWLGTRRLEAQFNTLGYARWWRAGQSFWDSSYGYDVAVPGSFARISARARNTSLGGDIGAGYCSSPFEPDGYVAGIYADSAGMEFDGFNMWATDGSCAVTPRDLSCEYSCN